MKGYARYYATNTVKLGGVRIPHLYPGDSLNLQTAQNADNGFSELEKALLRYIAAGLGVSYEQLSRDYSQVSYSSAGHPPMSRGGILWENENLWPVARRHRCLPAGWRKPLFVV